LGKSTCQGMENLRQQLSRIVGKALREASARGPGALTSSDHDSETPGRPSLDAPAFL